MNLLRKVAAVLFVTIAVCAVAFAADFEWDWRSQEIINRNDPSVGNTSKLTEPERAELLHAIVARLQKPMSDQGYDEDRIHDIASTTRLRFPDLGGDSKPLLLAASIGIEGGCDAMANCPFWIFRHTEDGYVSLLDTVARSYTVQPTISNGFPDLVLARRTSADEDRLTLYHYADGKYVDAGCYTATWPAAKDGESQNPTVGACKD